MGQTMGCVPNEDDDRETTLNPANRASEGNVDMNTKLNTDDNNNNNMQYYAILNLKEENKELHRTNNDLKSTVVELKKELDDISNQYTRCKKEKTQLNGQIIKLKNKIKNMKLVTSTNNTNYDDNKINKMNNNNNNIKKQKFEPELDKTDNQIEIINSERWRRRSLLFCSKIDTISSKKYSFIEFLSKHMNNKISTTLFNQIKSDKINSSQLLNILTYTATIYAAKLHHDKNGKNNIVTNMRQKVRQSVTHLSVWIIRNYGIKQNKKDYVCVYDDDGNQIKGEYNLYDITVTSTEYTNMIHQWVKSYVDNDGQMMSSADTDNQTVTTTQITENIEEQSFEECDHSDLLKAIVSCLNDKKHGKLQPYQDKIIEYCTKNNIDGTVSKTEFVSALRIHLNNKKLSAALSKLYTSIKSYDFTQNAK